ncbi:MAG: response regulator [Dysgonamonadaceae bacterium]|jgi:signal transduction histidine kinase/ligand-binding sensor domain-containing protein/DNA-binding response OmpR family regulator|nr:response regulator [Dysgonamonadaceae bacterium]
MKKHLFLLALFSVFAASLNADSGETFTSRYNTAYITMDNGLLHNFIDDIYRDSRGFLWISTGGGGLSRYDGYDFIHYNTNTLPVKLKSNFISNVCEDDFSRLWIASEGGIDVVDLKTLKNCSLREISTLEYLPAFRIIKDSKGCIWIFCGNSLNKICFDEKGNIGEIFTLSHSLRRIRAIALKDIDGDGNIWAGLDNRVCKIYQSDGGTLKAVRQIPALQLEENTLVSAFILKENELWIGTDNGLVRYDRNHGTLREYSHSRTDAHSLSQNHVTDLAVTANSQLLIGTLLGINVYNPVSDDFEHIEAPALNSNFVNCLLSDGDIIWIGTESGGINRMNVRKLSVNIFVHNKEVPYSLSANPVNAVYEDASGSLWVGTVEGGLNRKLAGERRFTHYTAESATRLSHNSVSAITADAQNRLWLGTWGGGVNLLDLQHPEKPRLRVITDPDYPGIWFTGALCYDSINNGMWIGSNPGIFFYDFRTERLTLPFPASNEAQGIIGALIDRDSRLWLGALDGLYVIDLKSRNGDSFKYHYLRYKLDNPKSGMIEKICAFCLTADGEIWLGSNGYGAYRAISVQGADNKVNSDSLPFRFEAVTSEQGLISNNIRGILEDWQGMLWFSTNNGLSRYDRKCGRFTNYTKEKGLLENQFYWNAYCRSHSGMLYFGGLGGLLEIEGGQIASATVNQNVTLTRLRVGNRIVSGGSPYTDVDISLAKVLRLHERDKSFSLEFSALNFEPELSATYAYRLEGFDEQWIETPATRRFASYTNLPAGNYVFRIKYIPEGSTGEDAPVTELRITVRPFFYKTAWFIALLFAVSGICAYAFFSKRAKRHREQIEEMSRKVQEMTVDKLSFFTNITHEFRTPITLIIGPIERALKLSSNPKVIEQLNFVERNSKYLLSLVNQLMDFRKVESGKLEIAPVEGNFREFVETLLLPFEAFAAERNIRLEKYVHLTNPMFVFDHDAMQKIINNLLSNAVKFTPNGGTIKVYLKSFNRESDRKLYIAISDTGSGIPEDALERVFERFYQASGNVKYPVYGQSGTGIGLYLSKRLVELHGGTISVRNNPRCGCTFSIILPAADSVAGKMETNKISVPETAAVEPAVLPKMANLEIAKGKIRILVVEDNSDMRAFITSILSPKYVVAEAGNGQEALEILNGGAIDFVITDLMMPVMDGLELSRRIKENFAVSHIPVLILTAKTAPEAKIEGFRAGADEYLVKPFNEELLLARIENIMENRRRYQRLFATSMNINDLPIEEESSDKKFVNRALEIMKANYKNSEYDAKEFVQAMGVSKSLLNNKLQSLTGQSVGQFIRNYRLNIAYELLTRNRITRSMNISEIAYDVGFNDPKYFTRCFSKRYNLAPRDILAE